MAPRDLLAACFEALADHPRRTIASSLSVFWASAAILVLLAWGSGFRSLMEEELGRYGQGGLRVRPGITSSGFPGFRSGRRVAWTLEDIEVSARGHGDRIEALLPEYASETDRLPLVEAEGRVRRLPISAVDDRWAGYRNFQVSEGEFFGRSDVERARPVAVLGYDAAEALFEGQEDVVGRTVRIDGQPFRVVGVAASKGRQYIDPERPDDNLLIVPITAAEKRLGYDERTPYFTLIARPGVNSEAALAALLTTLGPRASFHPEDDDAVRWNDTSELLGVIDLLAAGFFGFVAFAGTITLLVGGVGIANLQLTSLAERSVEIATAKAVGARDRTLVLQAVLEALIVAGGASLLGTLTGLATCSTLGALLPPGLFPAPQITWPVLLVSGLGFAGVAVAASVMPALSVRRIDVSAALRAVL